MAGIALGVVSGARLRYALASTPNVIAYSELEREALIRFSETNPTRFIRTLRSRVVGGDTWVEVMALSTALGGGSPSWYGRSGGELIKSELDPIDLVAMSSGSDCDPDAPPDRLGEPRSVHEGIPSNR